MIRLTDLAGKGSFTMGGKKFEYGKVYSNPYATAFKPVNEGEESEDHEVSMAQNQLDSIIKSATELKQKMGEEEKQIPAWIQDHITNSENYISQAASNYHEYGDSNEEVNEAPAQTKGEKIQRYNDRVKKLRDKISSTKNSEQKMKYQTTLKGILQRLSDIRKDHAIKAPHREGVNEAGPCWKGYKQVGMKNKGGKEVPNCVPEGVEGTDKAKQYIANLKKLGAAKEKLEAEMDYVVSNIYVDAELQEGCGCK